MNANNSISFLSALGLTVTTPVKTAATVAVVTFKSVEAAASIIADNQEKVVDTTKVVVEESLNLMEVGAYGLVKANVELRRNLGLGNKSLKQLREEAYASLEEEVKKEEQQ